MIKIRFQTASEICMQMADRAVAFSSRLRGMIRLAISVDLGTMDGSLSFRPIRMRLAHGKASTRLTIRETAWSESAMRMAYAPLTIKTNSKKSLDNTDPLTLGRLDGLTLESVPPST